MSYVGDEIVAAIGSPDCGGWLRLRNMDDLGIVEAKIDFSKLHGDGDGSIYLDIDEMATIFGEFCRRVKARRADVVIRADSELEAVTGTDGAKVLRLVRNDEAGVDPGL